MNAFFILILLLSKTLVRRSCISSYSILIYMAIIKNKWTEKYLSLKELRNSLKLFMISIWQFYIIKVKSLTLIDLVKISLHLMVLIPLMLFCLVNFSYLVQSVCFITSLVYLCIYISRFFVVLKIYLLSIYSLKKEIISSWVYDVKKLLIRNLIVRISIFILTFIFNSVGVSLTAMYILITCIFLSLICFTVYKSDNKLKCIAKVMVNIAIIYIFWFYTLKYSNQGLGLIVLFIANNILFIFGDWSFDFDIDLSGIIDSLGLHNECMNNAPRPPNNFGPQLGVLSQQELQDIEDIGLHPKQVWDYYEDDFFTNNCDDFIFINTGDGVFKFHTPNIQKAISLNNELVCKVDVRETPVKAGIAEFIINKNELYERMPGLTPLENLADMLNVLDRKVAEHNTLLKAKTFYTERCLGHEGLLPDNSYEQAFYIWKKRQVDLYNVSAIPALCERLYCNHAFWNKYFTNSPFEVEKYYPDLFKDEQVYEEIKENILYIEMQILQYNHTINVVRNLNLQEITYEELDSIMKNVQNSYLEDYTEVLQALHETRWKRICTGSKLYFENQYKTLVYGEFYNDDMSNYPEVLKYLDFLKDRRDILEHNYKGIGSGLELKYTGFWWNFNKMLNNMPLLDHKTSLFSQPVEVPFEKNYEILQREPCNLISQSSRCKFTLQEFNAKNFFVRPRMYYAISDCRLRGVTTYIDPGVD